MNVFKVGDKVKLLILGGKPTEGTWRVVAEKRAVYSKSLYYDIVSLDEPGKILGAAPNDLELIPE